MKTTLDLSDPLFNAAKKLAEQSHTTLRALVEEGLRRVLADHQTKAVRGFKLKDARVRGKQMLVTDPRAWQQLEQEHVIERVARS